MAAGIQPPSSSSRIRPRSSLAPPAASQSKSSLSSPQHRQTIVTSNAYANSTAASSPTAYSSNAPLESVVIRSDYEQTPSKDSANNDNNDNVKTTNVKVCVRLRPLLSSDLRHNVLLETNGANNAPLLPTPGKGGKGFARDTASSSRHAAASAASVTPRKKTNGTMRKHSSGLATPTATSTAVSPSRKKEQEQKKEQDLLVKAMQQTPSWTTHAHDPARISQAAHTTSATQHHNPERLADYSFDRVFAPKEPTKKLYDESIRGVVASVVEGFHGSVFAYGQTNSGKTHTMAGSRSEAGVVRLAVQDIFHRIRSQNSSSTSREYLVRVSYLEIYNEQIYDLLALPSQSKAGGNKFKSSLQHHHLPPSTSVRIFESRTEGVVVRGLREEIVTSPEEVFALLDSGDSKRKVGSTGMNKTSSRSHSVFRLVLESRSASRSGSHGGGPSSNSSVNSDTSSITQQSLSTMAKGPVRISSLSLVDLAGSESVKATGSTGVRQKEGQYINKSLLTLGHVVHKLSEISVKEKQQGSGVILPKEHIPYRDSKLTRLLQPSLGGNAQVCIICNISPALANLEESHNTLKFAMRAKKIQQHARITEVADEKTLLRSYREEIEELKRQLKEAKRVADEATQNQQQQRAEPRTPRNANVDGSSSDEDDDQDDTHVLVSAIANLESLILQAGGKSTRKANAPDGSGNNSLVAGGGDGEDSTLPSRALDSALMKAEDSENLTNDSNAQSEMSSLATSGKKMDNQHDEEDGENGHLLEELHRIQGMLGTVMKKKRKGGTAVKSSSVQYGSPERDAEVERLRMQLQEQEVTSTMRKADSSFLQSQLNMKEGILKEVSVLLEALEKRQIELESENKQLKDDLADATNMIEEGNAARHQLEKRLTEKDAQLAEKNCIVFVERGKSTSPALPIDGETTSQCHSNPVLALPQHGVATTVEMTTLSGETPASTDHEEAETVTEDEVHSAEDNKE